MGNYDDEMLQNDDAQIGFLFGQVATRLFIFINSIIMLNFVIAILAGTYAELLP